MKTIYPPIPLPPQTQFAMGGGGCNKTNNKDRESPSFTYDGKLAKEWYVSVLYQVQGSKYLQRY